MLYIHLAISYWRFHKKRALTILLAVLLGTAACFCSLLFVRSLKVGEMEEGLDEGGNYDMVFYISSEEAEQEIEAEEKFDSLGTVYRLGTAVGNQNMSESKGMAFPIGSIKDKQSERMWHLTPVEGRYPEKSGEITMDAQTMKSMGYPAETNQKFSLTLYDNKGEEVSSKDFTVVGVIEQVIVSDDNIAGNGGAEGLWRSYEPLTLNQEDVRIAAPYAYLSSEDVSLFSDLSEKILLANVRQSDKFDDQSIGEEYVYDKGYIDLEWYTWTRDDIRFNNITDQNRSSVANNIVLSWKRDADSNADLNTYGLLAVQKRMESGRGYADSTTRIVIPVISVIIMLLTVISAYEAVKAAMAERSRMMGLLRCLGLTKKQAFFLLVTEMFCLSLPGIGMGYLLGLGIYEGLRLILENGFGTTVYSAFSIDAYFLPFIRKVTFEPGIMPILLIGGSVVITALFAAFQMSRLSPLQAYISRKRMKSSRRMLWGRIRRKKYFSPVRLFARRVQNGSWFERSLMCGNVLLLMVSAVFGYVYFRQTADITSADIAEELEETCLSDYDYFAVKTLASMTYDDNFHNMGITPDDYEKISSMKGVKEVCGTITDRNTKLSLKKTNKNQDLMDYLESMNYSTREKQAEIYSDMSKYQRDVERAYTKMEKETMRRMGYDDSYAVYNVPTVAVRAEALQELSAYVAEGTLNWDKLNSGEETAVVLLEEMDLFHVGKEMLLSQVIYPEELDESEEYLDGRIPASFKENNPVYHIKHGKFETDYYICGTKKEITTRIGAVLVLDEEAAKKYYCISLASGECPVNFLTGVDSLAAWDVPDENYTQIQVALSEDISKKEKEQFENVWYQIMARTSYMYVASRSEKESKLRKNNQISMGIFSVLIILLSSIGALGIMNVFAIRLQNMKRDMALVRLIGADKTFLKKVVLRRFLPIPVICGVLSAVPVVLMQKVYDYGELLRQQEVKKLAEIEDITNFDWSAWYFNLPKNVNLYQYHLPIIVLVVIIVTSSIFLLGLMPQITKMGKVNLVEEVKTGD